MILAQLSTNVPAATTNSWIWGMAGACTILATVLVCWNQLMKALDRHSGKSNVPQPLTVEIAKQMHEQFADKTVFQEHVEHNTGRHAQLFREIERVEREARAALEVKFADLAIERRESLEKLNEQFVFIREHIASINTELKLRRRS
jgi:hypothetical protein